MRHIVIVAKSLDLTTRAVLTEKKLVLAKKPDGRSEAIAVLAFALAESGLSDGSASVLWQVNDHVGICVETIGGWAGGPHLGGWPTLPQPILKTQRVSKLRLGGPADAALTYL